jgi:hypothetical protein
VPEESTGFGGLLPFKERMPRDIKPSELTLIDLMSIQGELHMNLLVAGMLHNDVTAKLAATLFQNFIDGPLATKEAKKIMADAIIDNAIMVCVEC